MRQDICVLTCVCFLSAWGFQQQQQPTRAQGHRLFATTEAPSYEEQKDAIRGAALLADRGFARSSSADAAVLKAVFALLDATEVSITRSLAGNWTLLWTDAPDILNLGSPLARVGRIGQEIKGNTIENIIEYYPPTWVPDRFRKDNVEQRVILEYERSGNKVDLKVKGLKFAPKTLFGFGLESQLTAAGPLALPFGSFDILFNDGDLRIVRTTQGFYSVNERRRDGASSDDDQNKTETTVKGR